MFGFRCGLSHLVTLFVLLLTSLVAAAPWGADPGPFAQPNGVHITSVSVDLKVPNIPTHFASDDTIFIWPGVQPGTGLQDGDPENIGNGILVPSLTYGRSCAPGGGQSRNSWWISGSYFNVPAQTQDTQFAGCHGGDVMTVEPGEVVSCSVTNPESSTWTQTCRRSNGQSVSYTIIMNGQQMNWASLTVQRPTSRVNQLWNFPVYFYNYRFTTSAPMPLEHCVVAASGDDFLAQGSSLSADRKTCSLDALAFWNIEASATPVTSIPSDPRSMASALDRFALNAYA